MGQLEAPAGEPASKAPEITAPRAADGGADGALDLPEEAGLDAGPDAAPDAPSSDAAPVDAGPDAAPVVVVPPTIDGTIAPGEYGAHVNGQNQQETGGPGSTTWLMTWTETHLFVAVTAASVTEAVVLYLDHTPKTPSTSGTNADGSLLGAPYDSTNGSLPFRADFALYVKNGYHEYRASNGAGGWSAATANSLTVSLSGTTREIAIPWSAVRAGGRPASFSWLGYATSPTGYVYGATPSGNPGGAIGQNASFGFFYTVSDATPGGGTKPFASRLSP